MNLLWCVCQLQHLCPRGPSFDGTYIETHVFRESPLVPGEYTSLNDKTVRIGSETVATVDGFAQARVANVVGNELVYGDSAPDTPYRLLYLDAPLEGPARPVAKKVSLPLERSFAEVKRFLNSFPENELVLRKVKRKIDEFRSSYIMVKGYERHAVEKVRKIAQDALEQLVCTNVDLRRLYHGL